MTYSDDMSKERSALAEYITVAIADDMDLAKEYKEILAKNDIPAVTATQRSYSSAIIGIAVMVPENYLEQAQEIIESQQQLDGFLDDAFNDTDDYSREDNHFDDDDDDFGPSDEDY
ncbi:MAG: DUF2007 domain-containing protein [Anaerohalosphaeraceae bacterium]|nr:DUF2007 domain-containing protein [Anaerohalosphaeraceae bacterium]